ncbi:MAG: C25 family cysteine peptidase [Marinoscillum sp.]
MLRNRLYVLFTLLLVGSSAWAQDYANDWIDHSKEYYKIRVAKDGMYRITASELSNAGVPVGNVAVSRYQLFRRGKEVAISTRDDNGDGRLDYFEFYGEKNDGTGDKDLYLTPEAQPHSYYSLFSDTASYFLTWHLTSASGKRMGFSSFKDATGLTPQTYHTDQNLQLQTSQYSSGVKYGSSFDIQNASYEYGEGWTGPTITKNGSQTYSFNLGNRNTSGPNPVVEVLLAGVSNFDHLTQISVGPNTGSLRNLDEADFDGRYTYKFTQEINWSDVGPGGELIVRVTSVGYPSQTDAISVSYVKVDYTQNNTLSGSEKTYYFKDLTANRGYVRIPTTSGSAFSVFDVTDPQNVVQVATTAFSDRLEFVYQDSTTSDRVFFVKSSNNQIVEIKKVTMRDLSVSSSDYFIIYHPLLNVINNGSRPVDDYVAYRQSANGGGHDVLSMSIEEVYNQFNYGDQSPVAIKNLMTYSLAVGDPQYLFLIGKGTTVNLGHHRKTASSLTHFIPTYGYPGSDVLFSVNQQVGFNHLVPTGRLNAYSAQDVRDYYNKVVEMEAVPYNSLWRKNLVQLSGGITPSELRVFENYIQNFKSIAEGEYLGGKASNINKGSTAQIATINIADEVNAGVNMITFFGHSSNFITDLEIGLASDPSDGYVNKGKYPTFLVNGCNAGEIFTTTLTFGEDWVKTPNAGAIAFIANSDFALSSNLKRFADNFYLFAFANEETFGQSVGQLLELTSKRYFDLYGTGGLSQSQVYQTVLQGDPAIKVFGATSPDYAILGSETFASADNQERVLANLDSFQVNLVIRNYGKGVKDSLKIEIQRTYSDGNQETYIRNFEHVLRQDTLVFTIQNNASFSSEGTNTFIIRLDPNGELAELSEDNNVANFSLFIPKGNTIPIFPTDYGIVEDDQVSLVWQSANQLEQNREYSLEVDTTALYNSGFLMRESLSGGLVMRYDLDIQPLEDSTTVYWRTRFAEPINNEDTNWVESSFSLIKNQSDGWSQVGGWQLAENAYEGMKFDPGTKTIDFSETNTPVQINTHGVGSDLTYQDYQVIVDGLNLLLTDAPLDPECKKKNAINAIVFSKTSAKPYRPFGISGADVNNDMVCGRIPQMIHNFDQNQVLGANRLLDSLISVMLDGDMILLFSFDSVAFSNWDAQLYASLNHVGIKTNTLSNLTDGQPVIFLGRKGEAVGSAIEVISSGSSVPLKDQAIELINEVTGKQNTGAIKSTRIGPAKTWNSFHYNVNAESSDYWTFNVSGISKTGMEEPFFTGTRQAMSENEIDLTGLSAETYPYLRLDFFTTDVDELTPAKLNSWGVSYDFPPEGVLVPVSIATVELQEGEENMNSYRYVNLSDVAYQDSLSVEASFTNVTSGDRKIQSFNILAPSPGDTTNFDISTPTVGAVGNNNLTVKVTPAETELLMVNNALSMPSAFTVKKDNVNPVLDVTFDGTYILDGDIVSPTPNILIKFKDENPYLYKSDTTGINIELKGPCESCVYERVNLASPDVTYKNASDGQDFEINYMPGSLEDGVYYLKVQGTDESGNKSSVTAYEISFEVINESSITHFYPYPNPFSTSTRFVFTLTGSTIPDQLKIQIMTVSGRVVREITRDEIGPLKIGNNISQYAWDGKDEFGDQLANGVYLYKVFIEQGGETIKHRVTTADRAFKNGFGKIYLLR